MSNTFNQSAKLPKVIKKQEIKKQLELVETKLIKTTQEILANEDNRETPGSKIQSKH